MDNITKTMLSCEDKAGKIANNFLDMGKALQQMGLIDRIRAEVVLLSDIATEGIRLEFENKEPNAAQIIKELKMSINDGYKGLSLQLSKEIINF